MKCDSIQSITNGAFMNSETLVAAAAAKLGATKFRGNRWHGDCPHCGSPMRRNRTHFVVDAKGAHCFVCGAHESIAWILRDAYDANHVDLPEIVSRETLPEPEPAWWLEHRGAMMERYTSLQCVVGAWRAYKPVSRETIEKYQLGVGYLPAREIGKTMSGLRLIVPIIEGGEVVALAGRLLPDATDSGPKWLRAPDAPKTRYLWNSEADVAGKIVWIVENPVDVMLLMQLRPDDVAMAPSGVSLKPSWWQQEAWRLKAAKIVLVCYDNDAVGRAADSNLETDVPPYAQLTADALRRCGVPATHFHEWQGVAGEKESIVDVMVRGAM